MGTCLQVFADLRCIEMQATLAGNKRWEKSQPFIIFPKSEEEMNMDALRREGKEIQGLMRSLKDASGQYRNFSAGSLPGCVRAAMEHVGNTCKHNGTHTYKHTQTTKNCKNTPACAHRGWLAKRLTTPFFFIVTYRNGGNRWREHSKTGTQNINVIDMKLWCL